MHACVNREGRPTRAPDWLVAAMKGAATSGSTLPEGYHPRWIATSVWKPSGLTEAAAMEIEFFDFEDRWIRRTRTIGAACSRSRADWCVVIGSPKGGKTRRVPMTKRLAEALSAIRHLRGPRALYQHDGDPVTETTLRSWMERAERAVALPVSGHIHRLRHTFCSHVAMNAVPMKAIQVWAGHADLKTTQRYMHLSPEGMDSMISVLERGAGVERKSNRVRK